MGGRDIGPYVYWDKDLNMDQFTYQSLHHILSSISMVDIGMLFARYSANGGVWMCVWLDIVSLHPTNGALF